MLTFSSTVPVRLTQDAHLIVVAAGEHSDLSKGWGLDPSDSPHPVAFTNPIYVDIDGEGFDPNADTLGHALLVEK